MALRRPHEEYASLAIAAAPGTQEAVVEALSSHVPGDGRVLDFGAHTGAMVRRLKDRGFRAVTASDLSNRLADPTVPFVEADLNGPFAERFTDRFDAISACEVIEHLNDPRHFLNECWKLLADDGTIVVSTPNIGFFEGRIKFLLTGELWGFGGKNYVSQRHISAISRQQFPILFAECGFDLVESRTAGSFASRLRTILLSPIWLTMRLVFGDSVLGESRVVVGRRVAAREVDTLSEALWG